MPVERVTSSRGRRADGVAIIGAGGHGLVVGSTLEEAGVHITGYYDDDPRSWGGRRGNARVLGPIDQIAPGTQAILAIGDNRLRESLAARLDLRWVSVVHPFSWIDPGVTLGEGTVVCAGVTVQVGSRIGSHVILNNRAGVGHEAYVMDFAHLTVCHLGARASAERGSFLALGSIVLPGVRVGRWATVGAGAIVSADVRDGATVVGNPARETMPRPARQRPAARVGLAASG